MSDFPASEVCTGITEVRDLVLHLKSPRTGMCYVQRKIYTYSKNAILKKKSFGDTVFPVDIFPTYLDTFPLDNVFFNEQLSLPPIEVVTNKSN